MYCSVVVCRPFLQTSYLHTPPMYCILSQHNLCNFVVRGYQVMCVSAAAVFRL